METRKVEILLEAVQTGSFSRTAEKLKYSQSALVHMMHSLEKEIGIPLLTRSHLGVTLSPEGRRLEPLFRALVETERRINREVREIANESSNKIRIVTIPSIATYWLPDVIRHMREQYPLLEMEISVADFDVCHIVEKGEADFGFTDADHVGENEWLPLVDDQWYAAVPASWQVAEGTSISLTELAEHTILFPGRNDKNRAAAALWQLAPQQSIRVVAPHGGITLLSMVERGLGVTILSQQYASICPSTVRMLPTDPPFFRTIGIVARSFASLNTVQTQFITCLKEHPAITGQPK